MAVTRRHFIHLLGSSTMAIVAGCTRSGPEASSTIAGTTSVPEAVASSLPDIASDLPFSVWADVLDAVRTSPDHLAARAQDAVASRDPEAVFRFVRDSIMTVPPRADGFRDAARSLRSGVRSVLRTGCGTPREKVEVLADLLRQAGYDAQVVIGFAEPGFDTRPGVLRGRPFEFAPAVPDERAARWFEALGVPPPTGIPRLDPDGSVAVGVSSAVLFALGSARSAQSFDWTISEMPLVEVEVGGGLLYANPLNPDATWGDPYATLMAAASPVVDTTTIGVALQVAFAADPSVRHTVVEAAWPLDMLTGRRVVARFVPEGDPDAVLATPPARLLAHTAVLVVDGPDVDLDSDPSLVVFGGTVTVGGSILSVENDHVMADGRPFGADPVAPSAVAGLEATVSARAFPHIKVSVAPSNSSGDPVFGVPADAFNVAEDGLAVPFVLAQTRPPAPTILLVFDTSGSIPETFRGDGAVAFGLRLAETVADSHPDASYRVGGVASGSLAVSPTLATDLASLESEIRRVVGFGSDVWSALAQARYSSPTLVVLISDGQLTDPPEAIAAARSWIASGPPVVAIGVGEIEPEPLAEIASLSGGAVFEVAEHEEAAAAVSRFLDQQESSPIEIVYRAPVDGPPTRSIAIRSSGAEATVTYTVPEATERLDPPSLAGIYLKVTMDGQEIVRTLVGAQHETAVRTTVIDAEMRNDIHAALFGSVMLSVEGAAPTYAAWLDDALVTRQTWRPMLEASARGESPVVAAIEARLRVAPPQLPVMHSPLEGDALAATFEVGPRLVLLSQRPLWDGGVLERADILPFTRFVTVGPDPEDAFRINVERTARLAAAEAAIFDDHTLARLEGRALTLLEPFGFAPREVVGADHVAVLDGFSSWHRLFPEDEGLFGVWAVDANGSLLGILPDGSGGGSKTSSANEKCKTVSQAAGVADTAGAAVGLPMPWGAFIALQKAIVKQAIREAAIIESLGGPMPDTSECGSPGDFPCDVAKGAVYDAIPYAGKAVAMYDSATAAATGNDAVSC